MPLPMALLLALGAFLAGRFVRRSRRATPSLDALEGAQHAAWVHREDALRWRLRALRLGWKPWPRRAWVSDARSWPSRREQSSPPGKR